MRTSTLAVALVSALFIAGAGAGGVLAATSPLQAQQSPTDAGPDTPDAGPDTGTTDAGAETTAAASGEDGPSVTFNDQNSSGETVLVQSATLPENGFVAIYDSTRSNNETGQVIGASYLLNAGTSDNVRIQFDQPLNDSKSLTAVVHTDSNGNGEFDFVAADGQQDPPLTQEDRRIVDIAQVSAQGGDAGSTETDAGGGSNETEADGGTQTAADGAGDDGTAADGANESGDNGGSGAFGPGFGLVVAVVALLAVALLAMRRQR